MPRFYSLRMLLILWKILREAEAEADHQFILKPVSGDGRVS
jgi:hypothetical protein